MSRLLASRLSGPDRMQSVLFSRGAAHRASAYDPFGYRAGAPGGIAFNGQLPEATTGHYLLGHGHRGYSPALRRFLSPDALSPFRAGGLNAYAYCQVDPVNATDPTGRYKLGALLSVTGIGMMTAGVVLVARRDANPKYDENGTQIVDVNSISLATTLLGFGAGLTIGGAIVIYQKKLASLKARFRAGGTTASPGFSNPGADSIPLSVLRDSSPNVSHHMSRGNDVGSSVRIEPAGAESFVYNQAFHTERLLNLLSYFRSSRQSLLQDLRNFIPNARNRGLTIAPFGGISPSLGYQASNIRRS